MSVTFARPGDDEGIEMPVKEPISKSMFCMMFGLDENAFLYILNEFGSVEHTLLGSNSIFRPMKAGKFFVKTGDEEVDNNENLLGNLLNDLEEDWNQENRKRIDRVNIPRYPSFNRDLLKEQPNEIIEKIMQKVDYCTLLKLAATSERMDNVISSAKGIFLCPITLHVTFNSSFCGTLPHLQIQTKKKVNGEMIRGEFVTLPVALINILKPFRLECVLIDATVNRLSNEVMEAGCNFLAKNRIRTRELSVTGLTPTQAIALALKINVDEIAFRGDADYGLNCFHNYRSRSQFYQKILESFEPEELHNIKSIIFADNGVFEKCRTSDLFMRTVRRVEILRFETVLAGESVAEHFKPLLEAYFEDNERGLNKLVQIEVWPIRSTVRDILCDLLNDYKSKPVKHNLTGVEPMFLSSIISYNRNGRVSQFLVHAQFQKGTVLVTFGCNNDDVVEAAKKLDIEF